MQVGYKYYLRYYYPGDWHFANQPASSQIYVIVDCIELNAMYILVSLCVTCLVCNEGQC